MRMSVYACLPDNICAKQYVFNNLVYFMQFSVAKKRHCHSSAIKVFGKSRTALVGSVEYVSLLEQHKTAICIAFNLGRITLVPTSFCSV